MGRRIYLASSWRNAEQPELVIKLREWGHEVYDFRNPEPGDEGFHWSEIDRDWLGWSIGGHIAIEAMARYHEVAALMLTGTPPIRRGEAALAEGFLPWKSFHLVGSETMTDEEVDLYTRTTCGLNAPAEPFQEAAVRRTDGRASTRRAAGSRRPRSCWPTVASTCASGWGPAGALVVDVVPDRLTPSVLGRYLEVKARRLL